MAQLQLNLYTPIRDPLTLLNEVRQSLAPFIRGEEPQPMGKSGEETVRLRLMDDTWLTVAAQYNPIFMVRELARMDAFFRKMKTDRPRARAFVLECIPKFQGLVRIRFETTEERARTNCLMGGVFEAAARLEALTAAADGSLYQPDGRLLLGADGSGQVAEEELPEPVEPVAGQPGERPEDAARRQKNRELLQRRGIETPEGPVLAPGTGRTLSRNGEEIAQRAAALFAVAVFAETIQSGAAPQAARKVVEQLDRTLGGNLMDWVTPGERAYLESQKPPMGDTIDFAWRYEACQVLLWVLGERELAFPDHCCNATGIGSILWKGGTDHLLTDKPHRTAQQLLEEADLTFRCQWACAQAKKQKKPMPGKLDRGVVYERTCAFRWLLGEEDWETICRK